MHVRHIVRQFAPMIGGLEDAVAQLAMHLQEQEGIRCSVVTLDRAFGDSSHRLPPIGEHLGIPVRRIPFYGSTRYPLAPAVLRELEGADLVHVHGIDFFFDFLVATWPLHRRPLVASTHGGFFHTSFASRAKRIWFSSVTRASAAGYRRIFGSSESDATMFRRIAPSRTMAIENGVNIEKWRGSASLTPQPTMIFIGRFSINKNVPALIRLVATLDAPWRLIVAGQPSDLSADDLRALAVKQGVSDRVEIHVSPDDAAIRALIGRASYVASASRYEGFGLSVVEGLSAGLTPLLSPIAPFRRLVERSGRGLVLDYDTPAASAAKVSAWHRDASAEIDRNVAAADVFGWPGVAAHFALEYRAVLNGMSRHSADSVQEW